MIFYWKKEFNIVIVVISFDSPQVWILFFSNTCLTFSHTPPFSLVWIHYRMNGQVTKSFSTLMFQKILNPKKFGLWETMPCQLHGRMDLARWFVLFCFIAKVKKFLWCIGMASLLFKEWDFWKELQVCKDSGEVSFMKLKTSLWPNALHSDAMGTLCLWAEGSRSLAIM